MMRENGHEETPAQFKRLRRQEQENARRAGIVTRENAQRKLLSSSRDREDRNKEMQEEQDS